MGNTKSLPPCKLKDCQNPVYTVKCCNKSETYHADCTDRFEDRTDIFSSDTCEKHTCKHILIDSKKFWKFQQNDNKIDVLFFNLSGPNYGRLSKLNKDDIICLQSIYECDHKCHIDECFNRTTGKKNLYCNKHKCKNRICDNLTIDHEWCKKHRCQLPSCENPSQISLSQVNLHYCKEHRCGYPYKNCKKMIYSHNTSHPIKSCSMHKCIESDCHMWKNEGDEYCGKHEKP